MGNDSQMSFQLLAIARSPPFIGQQWSQERGESED
jgi:hypothetical protein